MKKLIYLSTALIIAVFLTLPVEAISQPYNNCGNPSQGIGQGKGYGKKLGVCDSTHKRLRLNCDTCTVRKFNGKGRNAGYKGMNKQDGSCLYINNIKLNPAYPNPFQSSVSIPITMTESNDVSIKVYDLNGNIISTLQDGMLSQGDHTFTFTPSDLTPGRYIYVVKSGDLTRSRYIHYQP